MNLDNIDLGILNLLQQDGKMTVKELSTHLNLSPTPIYERIKKMEKEGVIVGYTVMIDRLKLNYNLLILCNVSLETHNKKFIQKFEKDICTFEEVLECFHIAGMYDYLLKILVKDMTEYQIFVTQKLASLENIGKVQSSFVLTEVKSKTKLKC